MHLLSSQAMADYNMALQMGGAPPVKVLVNRGLLHLQLMDHTSALLDFAEASKVHVCNSGSHTDRDDSKCCKTDFESTQEQSDSFHVPKPHFLAFCYCSMQSTQC